MQIKVMAVSVCAHQSINLPSVNVQVRGDKYSQFQQCLENHVCS